jgi:hypothetical protein
VIDASQFGGARKLEAKVDALNVETGETFITTVTLYYEADGTPIYDADRIAEIEAWQTEYERTTDGPQDR